MLYYRILADDTRYPNRWFLDEPVAASGEQIDARQFTYGLPYVGPLPELVPIDQTGREVAFNLAAFDMPVVTEQLARTVRSISPGEVESFPVTIGTSLPGFVILNAVCREAAMDESRTEILRWKPEDGRPDKVGRYRTVTNLAIDAARTHNRHIFRVYDWEIALIVSERLREALNDIEDLGITFSPV
jgi:hypothetical protein